MILHSLKFDIRSSSVDVDGNVDMLYSSNDLRAIIPPSGSNLLLHIERNTSPARLRIAPITAANGVFAEVSLCGGMCHYRDGVFYSECENEFFSETEFDVPRGVIRMNVGGSYDTLDDLSLLRTVLRTLLQSFVLPFYRLKPLHGAVVSDGDRTLMLLGKGGAGKTTTALKLMLAGYDLLSDDGPLFIHVGGVSYALSSLDCYHATDHTLELLPELRSRVVGGADTRGKYSIRRDRGSHTAGLPRRVTHIVQLDRCTVDEPVIEKLDNSEVTANLIDEALTVFRSSAFDPLRPVYSAHTSFVFDVVTSLMRDASVFRLAYADRHLHHLPRILSGIAAND